MTQSFPKHAYRAVAKPTRKHCAHCRGPIGEYVWEFMRPKGVSPRTPFPLGDRAYCSCAHLLHDLDEWIEHRDATEVEQSLDEDQ